MAVYSGQLLLGGTVQIEIILFGAFALLTIGRVAWELSRNRKRNHAEDPEWANAIK